MTAPVALVTGGNRGIGLAIAQALVEQGYQVHACARTPSREPMPAGIVFHPCDVADPAAVRRLFAAVGAAAGRLDLLVNNAGVAGSNSLDPDADDTLWELILRTNLTGTYLCSKAALLLLPDRAGRIVNIASVLGLKGVPDQTAYCAAKHGVVGFTRALALAVAARGITVNAVCPGWVDTEMAHGRFAELRISKKDAAHGTPLGRIAAADDVAGAVLFLAGPHAGHVTGQTLVVDGGSLA